MERIETLVSIWNKINAENTGLIEVMPETTDSAIAHESIDIPMELHDDYDGFADVESFLSFE
jgi:hypothetical protein